ncbi:hypothetical protein F5146DRAFT_9356 [Armillaria mellea]|nr:hypothetical protein F5146DRAFT_9356 [Armillaria mellea]
MFSHILFTFLHCHPHFAMAEHPLPTSSPPTGASDASTCGAPSVHPPGIFQEPSHRMNDGSRRAQPTPHSHLPPQQYGAGPSHHPHPPHPPNLFHRPPQPMWSPPYGVTQAPPPWPPAHTFYERFYQGYQGQPLNAPSSTYVHQGGVALPLQWLAPPHLPYGLSTYPPPQGHATPHDHPHPQAGSSSHFPVVPSQRVHDIPMPRLPYPQVSEASNLHYTLETLQHRPQDQNDQPHVPPPQAPEPVETKQKGKPKAPDSDVLQRAPKKSKKSKAPQLFAKRARPGRPPKAESEARKRRLEEWEAANAQTDATSHNLSHQGPSTIAAPDWQAGEVVDHRQAFNPPPEVLGIWPIPFQPEPSTPAPGQTDIPGNPQASTTGPRSATSSEASAADAREYEGIRDADPMFALIASDWLRLKKLSTNG